MANKALTSFAIRLFAILYVTINRSAEYLS